MLYVTSQIIWIDGQGAEQRRHEGTACGITLSGPHGVVRDSENRYLVADNGKNQLLLFSKDGGDVRCVVKDKITLPSSLYLDEQQDKLYVGTWSDTWWDTWWCMITLSYWVKTNL